MTATLLDGDALAGSIRRQIAGEVEAMQRAGERPPGLAVVFVGDDPGSAIYVRHKRRDCQQVGYHSVVHRYDAEASERTLLDLVDELNADARIDGVLVQSPVPPHIDENRLIDRIAPDKDVDGFHPYNVGRLAMRRPTMRPGTVRGIMQLLEHTGVALLGCNATVVGASNHVGRPMTLELLLAGCTVTTAHRFTTDLPQALRAADVVVSATGVAGLIDGAWLKEGAIVIDVGITRIGNRLIGDVQFESAVERAAWITPVPGGVGPMTRAGMLQNTMAARRAHRGV